MTRKLTVGHPTISSNEKLDMAFPLGHPAYAPEYSSEKGWSLWRGSGMLSSVAVVNDTSTSTRNTPGIHVATFSIEILEKDKNGDFQSFEVLAPSVEAADVDGTTIDVNLKARGDAPESHEKHFKALTNLPRSMLALTTCHAFTHKPCYTCTGAGVDALGESSIFRGGKDADNDYSRPDYLTKKMWAKKFPPSMPPPPPVTPPPPPPPSPPSYFAVVGPCTTDAACVRSPNYPSDYGFNEDCTVMPTSLAVGQLLSATAGFNTESGYDKLIVNGVEYDGTAGPSDVVLGSAFTWSSDSSGTRAGWEVCVGSTRRLSETWYWTSSPLPPPPPQPAAPHAGPFDLKLTRMDFVVDCNAAIIEICNKVDEQCQPFICKEEKKTYRTFVEAFGTAFANYGFATAILMPLFALVAKRIGRKPTEAAGETAVSIPPVSVPPSERKSFAEKI